MTEITRFQLDLVEQVEASSDWRIRKAAEYPEDNRNEHASKSLAKLAERLKALPLDDRHLVACAEAIERAIELQCDCFDISRYIGRYGFGYPQDGDPAGFLDGLSSQIERALGAKMLAIRDEIEEGVETFMQDHLHQPWKRFSVDDLIATVQRIWPKADHDLLSSFIATELVNRDFPKHRIDPPDFLDDLDPP